MVVPWGAALAHLHACAWWPQWNKVAEIPTGGFSGLVESNNFLGLVKTSEGDLYLCCDHFVRRFSDRLRWMLEIHGCRLALVAVILSDSTILCFWVHAVSYCWQDRPS